LNSKFIKSIISYRPTEGLHDARDIFCRTLIGPFLGNNSNDLILHELKFVSFSALDLLVEADTLKIE